MGTVLHAGCGYAELPAWLTNYSEVRLDIDPAVNPDVLASITSLGDIGPYDAILCQHCLEHLYPHDVQKALAEFYRVLAPDGWLMLFVPDLEDARPTDEVLFESPAGPIAGIDLFYGFRPALAAGMTYMAHHTGFTQHTLRAAVETAGFVGGVVTRHNAFNLGVICKKVK